MLLTLFLSQETTFKARKIRKYRHVMGTLLHVTALTPARILCYVTTYILIFHRCSQSGQRSSVNH